MREHDFLGPELNLVLYTKTFSITFKSPYILIMDTITHILGNIRRSSHGKISPIYHISGFNAPFPNSKHPPCIIGA